MAPPRVQVATVARKASIILVNHCFLGAILQDLNFFIGNLSIIPSAKSSFPRSSLHRATISFSYFDSQSGQVMYCSKRITTGATRDSSSRLFNAQPAATKSSFCSLSRSFQCIAHTAAAVSGGRHFDGTIVPHGAQQSLSATTTCGGGGGCTTLLVRVGGAKH